MLVDMFPLAPGSSNVATLCPLVSLDTVSGSQLPPLSSLGPERLTFLGNVVSRAELVPDQVSELFRLVESLLHSVLDAGSHSLQHLLPVLGVGQSALLYVTNLFLIIFKFFL